MHLNAEFAAAGPFKERVAHGMLTAGLISAVLGTQLPGPGTIYLGQTLRFRGPVKIGDTVTATVEVTEIDAEKKRAMLKTVCTVGGKTVIEGEATVLVPTPRLMRIFTDWRGLPEDARGAAVALGNFDGVHLGHAHVLRAAHGARPDAPLAVLTFEPHPREVFRPDDPPFRLTLPPARAEALAALGVKLVYELPFDAAFSEMTAEAFVTEVLHDGIGARHLVCGPDFAFGHRRGGDTAFPGRPGRGAGHRPDRGAAAGRRVRADLLQPHPPRAAGRLSRAGDREARPPLGDPRHRGAWRRARPHASASPPPISRWAAIWSRRAGVYAVTARAAGRAARCAGWPISAAARP